MSIEQLLSQISGDVSEIQQGHRQWEHGKYGGGSPRYMQDLANFETRWQNVFEYLDINDSTSIEKAYTNLEDDFKRYTNIYPEKLWDYELVKNNVTEMLDAYKGRSANLLASQNKLSELRETLGSYLDADVVQTMINDYVSNNPGKNNKDFRNHFVSNIAGIDKTIDDIARSIYLTTSQDLEGESFHKLRKNPFFNSNLLSIDDDTLANDILSAKQYVKALKGEMVTGLDAMLLLDQGDPWVVANQNLPDDDKKPYSLKWHVTTDEAAQLKMILNGDIDQTEYQASEALKQKQKRNAKNDVIENLKPMVGVYERINAIISTAEATNQKGWGQFGGDDLLNLTKSDGTTYLYSDLKGSFTDDILGGNYNLLPLELRKAFEAQAKLHPNNPIALTKDLMEFWRQQNLDGIIDEDVRYFMNFDENEDEMPFPVELQNPDIYPQGLKNLLRGNDTRWSRKSPKYGQYAGMDFVSLNKNQGLLSSDDIDLANQDIDIDVIDTTIPPVEKGNEYDVEEGDLDPDIITKESVITHEHTDYEESRKNRIENAKNKSYVHNAELNEDYNRISKALTSYESTFENIINDSGSIDWFDNKENEDEGTYSVNVGRGTGATKVSKNYIPTPTEVERLQKNFEESIKKQLQDVIDMHGPNSADPQVDKILAKEDWAKKKYLAFNKWKASLPEIRRNSSSKIEYEEAHEKAQNIIDELSLTIKERKEKRVNEHLTKVVEEKLPQFLPTTVYKDTKRGTIHHRHVSDPAGVMGTSWVEVPSSVIGTDDRGINPYTGELDPTFAPDYHKPTSILIEQDLMKADEELRTLPLPALKKKVIDMLYTVTIGSGLQGIRFEPLGAEPFVIINKKSISDWAKNATQDQLLHAIKSFRYNKE
tara:strand:+ start:8574 stop:11210 length:2637 start_codon:yes stop_codon:yes gene_type:complete